MLKRLTIVLSSSLIILLVCSSVLATNMTVFGLKFGEKFDVAECEKYGNTNVYKSPDKTVCFERFSVKFPMGDKKPPTTPIVNETVWIMFPTQESPDIAISNDIRAIVVDGNLESIFFYTDGVKVADFVLNSLNQKYGKPTTLTSSKVQNSFGATFDSYAATWTFDNLFVVYNSVTDRIDKGRVDINTKKSKEIEENRLKDLNKDRRVL